MGFWIVIGAIGFLCGGPIGAAGAIVIAGIAVILLPLFGIPLALYFGAKEEQRKNEEMKGKEV